jgi:hypothetical protein
VCHATPIGECCAFAESQARHVRVAAPTIAIHGPNANQMTMLVIGSAGAVCERDVNAGRAARSAVSPPSLERAPRRLGDGERSVGEEFLEKFSCRSRATGQRG